MTAETTNADAVAILTFRDPGGATSERTIREGESVRIGRSDANDIILNDSNLSRFHSVINAGEAAIFLTDLGSMNGTLVNGQRISAPVRLHHLDEIEVPGLRLTVSFAEHIREIDDPISDTSSTQALAMRPLDIVALVADVNGYTKMSEMLPNHEVSDMLDRWLDLIAKVVKAHNGSVEKIQGDSLLGIWRIEPSPLSKAVEQYSAQEAVQAAFEMQQSVDTLRALGTWKYESEYSWTFKISIHAGSALEGVVGRGEVRELTLIGDTVNVAFRLNELAHVFNRRVLFSGEIATLCEGVIAAEKLGSHSLQGRSETIDVYTTSEAGPLVDRAA